GGRGRRGGADRRLRSRSTGKYSGTYRERGQRRKDDSWKTSHGNSRDPGRLPGLSSTSETWKSGRRLRACLLRLDPFGQFRDNLEQVADHQQVGKIGDRHVFVLIDRHDGGGGAHADFVLNRA